MHLFSCGLIALGLDVRLCCRAGRKHFSRFRERGFFLDNLLVRICLTIVMVKWTGLAPREFAFPFPGILTSTFLRFQDLYLPPRQARNHTASKEFSGAESRGSVVVRKADLIVVRIQFEYDPDELATKITTQFVHKRNSKTHV